MKFYYQIEGDLRNNIGDVLQGMVAKAFLPESAKVVDREALADMDPNGASVLLANGWYMHSFEKFPPPPNVNPIYVSVHMAQSQLLADSNVRKHFKKHSPIGCRDEKTLKLFLGWGIPAYYSGCLTVTTKQRAPINNTSEGEVLLVDNIDHPIPEEVKDKLEKLLGKSFTRVSHDPPNVEGTVEEYEANAEKHMNYLLERYCKAALVVTTKIHCALPCLGMGANVMIIHPNPGDPRLATVGEFIDIVSYKDILAAESLTQPKVKKDVLEARKEFLKKIATQSVAMGHNMLQTPAEADFAKIKSKSINKAKLYRLIIWTLIKTGLANDHMKRIYGSQSR